MNLKAQIELKLRKFIKKYGRLAITVVVIIFIIIGVDRLLKIMNTSNEPTTTFKPNVPVLDQNAKVPDKIQKTTEEFVKEYVELCNKGSYAEAYDMISEDCKKEYFGSLDNYVEYVKNKFSEDRAYVVQSYSVYNKKYIFVVKLFENFIETGLTNSSYRLQEEKIVASYDKNKKLVFSVGNFIEKDDIQSVQENDYLKIDVKNKIVKYTYEEYEIKITNRTDDCKVVLQEKNENDSIQINLGEEVRNNELNNEVVLEPGESIVYHPLFQKFYDDGDTTKEVIFNKIKVYDDDGNEKEKLSMRLGM